MAPGDKKVIQTHVWVLKPLSNLRRSVVITLPCTLAKERALSLTHE